MRVVTRKELLATVAKRFSEEYQMPDGSWNWYQVGEAESIYASLVSNVTESDLIEIMGGDGWIRIECDECNQSVEWGIEFEHGQYGDQTIILCSACLKQASAIIKRR